MPGDMTHGFDMVIEFAERSINKVVSSVLDGSGLFEGLGHVIDLLPGVNISADGFRSSVSFDRPSGISFPAGAQPVDIRLEWLNSSGTVEAELRIVAGLVVDRSASDKDILKLDMQNALFHLELQAGSSPITGALLNPVRNWLTSHLPIIPILPVPVDRTSTDPKKINRADSILADAASDSRDAIGVALTFGGGTPGNPAAFTSGLIDWGPDDAPGAIAVFFSWILRMLDPALDSAFHQPAGTFHNGQLTRSFDVGDSTTLTAFSITLQDGFLAVSATVEKSGFCWSAKGTIGARVHIGIHDGRLQVSTQVDDPDVELDVPWYCYLAAAIVGALGGFLIGGIIGGVVGAILVPLLVFALEEGLESTLDNIADHVRDTLNQFAPNVDVPAVGINVVFGEVQIDDITIRCRTSVPDLAFVRASGTTYLLPGQALDLDSGTVGAPSAMEGADIRLDGAGEGREIHTVCAASLARTGRTDFDTFARWSSYPLFHQHDATVPASEMWASVHVPLIGDYRYPTFRVFTVLTGQGRRALVQVVAVDDQRVAVRWKTWDRKQVQVKLEGAFKCEDHRSLADSSVVFEKGRPFLQPAVAARISVQQVTTRSKSNAAPATVDLAGLATHSAQLASFAGISPALAEVPKADLLDGRVGQWLREAQASRFTGRFLAVTDGFGAGKVVRWTVDGRALEGKGTLNLHGVEFQYDATGGGLTMSCGASGKDLAMELTVEVSDSDAERMRVSRCIRVPAKCARTIRVNPKWTEYLPIYRELVGIRIVHPNVNEVIRNLPEQDLSRPVSAMRML